MSDSPPSILDFFKVDDVLKRRLEHTELEMERQMTAQFKSFQQQIGQIEHAVFNSTLANGMSSSKLKSANEKSSHSDSKHFHVQSVKPVQPVQSVQPIQSVQSKKLFVQSDTKQIDNPVSLVQSLIDACDTGRHTYVEPVVVDYNPKHKSVSIFWKDLSTSTYTCFTSNVSEKADWISILQREGITKYCTHLEDLLYQLHTPNIVNTVNLSCYLHNYIHPTHNHTNYMYSLYSLSVHIFMQSRTHEWTTAKPIVDDVSNHVSNHVSNVLNDMLQHHVEFQHSTLTIAEPQPQHQEDPIAVVSEKAQSQHQSHAKTEPHLDQDHDAHTISEPQPQPHHESQHQSQQSKCQQSKSQQSKSQPLTRDEQAILAFVSKVQVRLPKTINRFVKQVLDATLFTTKRDAAARKYIYTLVKQLRAKGQLRYLIPNKVKSQQAVPKSE